MRRTATLLFCAYLAVGCDPSEPVRYAPAPYDPTDETPLSSADFCTLQAKNACAALRPCCGAAHLSFDEVGCRANARALCEARKQRALEVGLLYDDVQGGRCARGQSVLLRRCSTEGVLRDPIAADVAEACAQTFHGVALLGESCEPKATKPCIPPSLGARVTCNGTCRPLTLVGVGEPCGSGGCQAGLACTGSPARCLPTVLPLGAACGTGIATCDVSDDAYCDPATLRCARYPGLGEPCGDTNVCARPYRCDNDKAGGKRCVAGKGLGAFCGEDRECETRQCSESVRACLPAPFGYPLSSTAGADPLGYVGSMAATCDGLLGPGAGGLSAVPLPSPPP